MVGIGKGAEQGILIKDAESLETAKRIDTIVLDKTGTITEGQPTVNHMVWWNNSEEVRNIFYSLEKLSEHPLANAITYHLKGEFLPLTQFESLTGQGVKACFNNQYYLAGNEQLLKTQGVRISSEQEETAVTFTHDAQTVIWFADEKQVLGIAAISDRIKETSREAISLLQQQGIDVVMLTGDNPSTAQAIARQAGISHYQAEVLPQQKAAYIKSLQQKGKCVAMVGDGINDSAALAQANLSIAMGKGSDIAMDVAKITLISSDLTKIPEAIRLSALTVRTIRQNLFWAFIYNLIGVPVAAGILFPINGFLLNPMLAGAAMAMSSVSVVTNSLRLRNKPLRKEKVRTK